MKRNRSLMPYEKQTDDLLPKIEKTLNIDLKRKPLFIGVSGGTASGKTSVCEMSVNLKFMSRIFYSLLFWKYNTKRIRSKMLSSRI